MMHYMAQCAFAGKIYGAFLQEGAKFAPVHHADVAKAVANRLEAGATGHWAVRGNEEYSIKQIMNMIEASCGKSAGATKAKFEIPLLDLFHVAEEFFTGVTHDRNWAAMVDTFANGEAPVTGESFWTATGTSAEESLKAWAESHRQHEDAHLAEPTFGAYKMVSLD